MSPFESANIGTLTPFHGLDISFSVQCKLLAVDISIASPVDTRRYARLFIRFLCQRSRTYLRTRFDNRLCKSEYIHQETPFSRILGDRRRRNVPWPCLCQGNV